ncbi:MAG: hypothetical protein Q9159_002096 [Coniocarpon cinnabarinum]
MRTFISSSPLRSRLHQPCARRILCPPAARYLTSSHSAADDLQRSSSPDPPTPPPKPPSPAQSQRLSFWPFLAIFALGTGAFAWMVRSREGVNSRPRSASTQSHKGPLIRKEQAKSEK